MQVLTMTAARPDTQFEEFWARYPKKREKPLARKAYEQALRFASHEDIMAGLERFIQAEPWKGDLHYCIFPERWLKRERWTDEYDEPKPEYAPPSRSQMLCAFLVNDIWRDEWPDRPASRSDAKAELDELNDPRHGLRVIG